MAVTYFHKFSKEEIKIKKAFAELGETFQEVNGVFLGQLKGFNSDYSYLIETGSQPSQKLKDKVSELEKQLNIKTNLFSSSDRKEYNPVYAQRIYSKSQ